MPRRTVNSDSPHSIRLTQLYEYLLEISIVWTEATFFLKEIAKKKTLPAVQWLSALIHLLLDKIGILIARLPSISREVFFFVFCIKQS